MQNRARSMEDLFALRPELQNSPVDRLIRGRASAFESAALNFRFAVTPYYLSLASLETIGPIWKQILPDEKEAADPLFQQPDPLAEESHMPVPGLTHRYPDRVLWYLSHNCAVYCRFCMRKRKVSREDSAPNVEARKAALDYIRSHTEIQEAILSGGDPLSQSDAVLASCIQELKEIPHLVSVRIHTRMPVTCPQRITDSFCQMIQELSPVTLVTHFNHPVELSDTALEALGRLRKTGNLILNQSVLLAGVNDNAETQRSLNLALLKAGVKPYYLHQCDEVKGVSHFRVNLETGVNIQKELRGRIPGPAMPLYVIDLPGGGGKVPVDSSYFVDGDYPDPVFENFQGDLFFPLGDQP